MKNIKHCKLIFSFVIIFLGDSIKGKLSLDDNRRYQDLLIYIEESVSEDNGKLLESIKTQMTAASKALYEATSNMGKKEYGVHFGTINILVPTMWDVSGDKIAWQNCQNANFRIVTKTSNGNSDKPFTKNKGKCGIEGEFSRFPQDFFSGNSQSDIDIRRKGKKIMQEFVKMRYGVFSEEPANNRILAFNGHTFIPSVCSKEIEIDGPIHDHKCSDSNTYCHYKIIPNQNHNYSVMFDTDTESSKYFCNDEDRPHNKFAKNHHNKICKQKSVTHVILEHNDFKNVVINNFEYKDPVFKVLKNEKRKIVLILDTSGSMINASDNMKTAVIKFIEDIVEDTAKLGIVTFNEEAKILSPLLKMNDAKNKKILTDLVSNIVCHDSTNIGHGLQLGIEVLEGNIMDNNTIPGTIILLSDGDNNENENIDYNLAIANVIKKRVTTNVISYNQSDQQLNHLSKQTLGTFLHVDYSSSITDLITKFAFKKQCDLTTQTTQMVKSGTIEIGSASRIKFTYIDKYTGTDPLINVVFPNDVTKYRIALIDPNGIKIYPTNITKNNEKMIVTFKIPGNPKIGQYWLDVALGSNFRLKRSTEFMKVTFSISSLQSQQNGRTIIPSGEISEKVIENLTGTRVVTVTIDLSTCGILDSETVSVHLKIKRPNNTLTKMEMKDDGIGDDLIANDFVFTKNLFSKDLLNKGFYTLVGIVEIKNEFSLAEKIMRTVTFEALLVKDINPSAYLDEIPPAQMQDPDVYIQSLSDQIIKLKTLATGDDSMDGTIDKYEVKVSSLSKTIMVTMKAKPYEEITIPLNLQKVHNVDKSEVSIRGIDDANNYGPWSTPVLINFQYY